MPNQHDILITGSNRTTGKLIFANGDDNLLIDKGWKIKWVIQDSSGVEKITGFMMKDSAPGNTNIFSEYPIKEPGNSKHWIGKVKGNASNNAQFIYSIVWKGVGESNTVPPHTFDPKIAVRPTLTSNITLAAILFFVLFSGMFLRAFFTKKKSRL